ncbi:restriction endonuclease subunit S [Methanosarcina mazei]|uniref:restriction endonuclease subunit S n=1 Tax=Methanosarcina mazei TaxID=2209 RepID=UPI003C75B96B
MEEIISEIQLPEHWSWVELKDLTENSKDDIVDGPFGSNLKSSEYTETGIPVFKIQNIKENRFVDKNINFVSPTKAEELSRHSFQKGDLIITKLGNPLGLCCKVPEKYPYGIIVADLMRFRPSTRRVVVQYLMYGINSVIVQNQFKAITKGTTRPRVNLTIVRGIKFPLPPLPEQRSIVSKIELLFSELDNGISNLKLAQEQLKVYRQAVLKKAFEGSVKVPFSDLVKSSQNGISKRSGKEGVELKVLRLADISNLEINYSSPRCIKLTSSEINKYKLLKDDLICIRVNGSKNLVGRLIITSEKDDLNNWAFCDHFIRFSLDLSNAVPKYYYYYFHTMEVRQYIHENMVSSAGQNTVSQGTIKSVLVPFSSHSEQQAIVQEIETRLSVCDKIEQDIKDNLEKAEALRQSILKKAFEGKLLNERELAEVRGAEDWEPAEVLLERIKAEKAQNGKK